ncbi:hypothetical protein A1O7_04521 [Cladophialophora yegresii CBS 114405]|uniref:Lysine-specific metallo-endopeptidase domain-containing protein n=1 Tax=Cladophialophora yegresii CBS 114405 TaxID=1182544 RepID=W9WPS5_9EURO|nr:uncharacterized protein A1O7_04521 [Cladophialophora yegresii CBS 114405]EXJ60369.1 hypothetical protein A1O7_04521 [Cladophialophora yegresii CBS 114405]
MEQTFLRYFRPENARFVKDIFRTIANIPLDLDLTDKNALAQLAAEPLSYHPKYNKLSIFFLGDHPGLPALYGGNLPPGSLLCADPVGWQAHSNPVLGGAEALISVCKKTFSTIPMLQDVTKPPAWAIDPSKDQSRRAQFYDGYGCENLGDTDSDYLDSAGAVLLHELLHFPGLFADVPNYDAMIPFSSVASAHWISDWMGPYPRNGYGAYNTMSISKRPPRDQDGRLFLPIYNADNYAWYAISSYFSRVCKKDLQDAPSEQAVWKHRRQPLWPFNVPPSVDVSACSTFRIMKMSSTVHHSTKGDFLGRLHDQSIMYFLHA